MAATAYLTRAPAGIPGSISRPGNETVEPAYVTPNGTTGAPAEFGIGGLIDATTGNWRVVAAGDTAINSFLVKAFPVAGGNDASNAAQALGAAVPPAQGVVNIMARGYMTVLLGGSTAAVKGGAVYIWSAASAGAHVIGRVEAASPGGSGFVLPSSYFTGPADADGNVEIAFNI